MTMQVQADQPVVLTIAGFDPSGGAGVIADVRTIVSFGCRPVAAITSLTFQNQKQIFGAFHQPAESVRAQVEAIAAANEIAAVKIGMLPTPEIVREVARLIRELKLPAPVIDPVMESTSGGKLMSDDAFETFVTELLPLARVVTPNISEAERLGGVNIYDEDGMRQAAARIRELGARAVLVKGGHRYRTARGSARVNAPALDMKKVARRVALDILDDNGNVTSFRGEWIEAPPVRGTGCMLSSATAANLAYGASLLDAVAAAKKFVAAAIQTHDS